MQKGKILIALLGILLSVRSAYGISTAELRVKYIEALENASLTDKLIAQLKSEKNASPLHIAYLGGLEALAAKHSWNPYTKMQYLRQSQETLAKAISLSPEDAEIRFLRFSVQHYVPSFLGYSNNLKEDKVAILRNLHKAVPDVKGIIARFMIDCGRCTEAEKVQIKAFAV